MRARRRCCRPRPPAARVKGRRTRATRSALWMLSRTCLPLVAEDRVRLTGDRAAHQVGEEAVQLGARVVGAGQAAAAKADGRHLEVAAVLLDQQVGGDLRDAEKRMGGLIDRHRRVDSVRSSDDPRAAPGGVELSAAAARWADRRRPCWSSMKMNVAVGACLRVASSRLSVPLAFTREVRLRVGRRPVVRRLRRGVDDQLDRSGVTRRRAASTRVRVADVERRASENSPG